MEMYFKHKDGGGCIRFPDCAVVVQLCSRLLMRPDLWPFCFSGP